MRRKIPKLQDLCLRSVGPHACSAEDTFAKLESGGCSTASLLLRSFHRRPALVPGDDKNNDDNTMDMDETTTATTSTEQPPSAIIRSVGIARIPCVGDGASRRAQANDVDLNHPMIAQWYRIDADTKTLLVMEYGNPAVDCLQAYIDSLVELGRMDDGRLGVHFFEEWKANVIGGSEEAKKQSAITASNNNQQDSNKDDTMDQNKEEAAASETNNSEAQPPPRKRSKRRTSNSSTNSGTTTLRVRMKQGPPPPLGALSLNCCAVGEETMEALRDSGSGIHLGVLDLTGIYNLNDIMLEQLLPHCPNLKRLSVKNCRRLTGASLRLLAQYQTKLQCLDVGGTYNIQPQQVLETLVVGSNPKNPPCPALTELHVSGLGWNDEAVDKLVTCETRPKWTALSLGFSFHLTQLGLRQSLSQISDSLVSLALHFCENVVDNGLMGMLGRNLPHVKYLDVRGNPSLSSMTGWYDGRVSADFHLVPLDETAEGGANNQEDDEDGPEMKVVVQELFVLARFSGISKASLEETHRAHPLQATKLTCVLDGTGVGLGIMR